MNPSLVWIRITLFLLTTPDFTILADKKIQEKTAPHHEDSTADTSKAKTDISTSLLNEDSSDGTKTQTPLNPNSADNQPVDEADGVCYAEEKPPDLHVIYKEDGVCYAEEKPPDLHVIYKEDGGGAQGKFSLPNPKKKGIKIIVDGVEREDGITIICSAEYPVYLDVWNRDTYLGKFYNTHEKCYNYPTDQTFCKIIIWFPKSMLYSEKTTRNFSFICTPVSTIEKAQMEKKAMISVSLIDNKTQVEILTTLMEKNEKRQMHVESAGNFRKILIFLFGDLQKCSFHQLTSWTRIGNGNNCTNDEDYNWMTDQDCYCAQQSMFLVQVFIMVIEEMMVWSCLMRVVRAEWDPNRRNRLARRRVRFADDVLFN